MTTLLSTRINPRRSEKANLWRMGVILPTATLAAPILMGSAPPMASMMVTPTFSFRCADGNLIEATPQSNNGLKIAVVRGPNRNKLAPQVLKAQPRAARAAATRYASPDGKLSFALPDRPNRDPALMSVNGGKPLSCPPAPGIRE